MLKGLKTLQDKVNINRLVEITTNIHRESATQGPPPKNGQWYKLPGYCLCRISIKPRFPFSKPWCVLCFQISLLDVY